MNFADACRLILFPDELHKNILSIQFCVNSEIPSITIVY